MDDRQRLLVCLRFGIGDLVMELPALRALRAQYPGAHITALGAYPALELLEGDPGIDAHMAVQDLGFAHWGDMGCPQAHEAFWRWFGAQAFDCILDGNHAVAGVRAALRHAPVAQFSTDEHVPQETPPGLGRGARAVWASSRAAWGLEAEQAPPPHLHVPQAARDWARAYLAGEALGARLLGLAPVASSALKRWPASRLGELVGSLAPDPGRALLVFGVAGPEGGLVAALREAAAPSPVRAIHPCHLQRTAALIGACHAFVSNDTGLMHMAAALGTPTVGIFGPTSPSLYLPSGATAVDSGDGCRHRRTDRFGPPECVLAGRCLTAARGCIVHVSVEAVHRALQRIAGAAVAGAPP